MATVGDQLLTPESGWRRLDDRDVNITYVGRWTETTIGYNNTRKYSNTSGDTIKFNFTGTKLRLLGYTSTAYSPVISMNIDGTNYQFSERNTSDINQILVFEKINLPDLEHYVTITVTGGSDTEYTSLDAIDIDESGELKPYNPTPSESDKALLRITMTDSSEREYKVSKAIADDFVNWCNRTIGTGNSCYVFDKGIQNSKEYLFYEKIISFEVIPVA